MKLTRPYSPCEGMKDASACMNCCKFDCVWNTQIWLRWRFYCYENDLEFGIKHCIGCEWFQDGYCMRPDGNGDYLRIEVEPDGFCAWGKRK